MKGKTVIACLMASSVATLPPATAAGAQEAAKANARPNVLLIVADGLGWSDIGAYGGEISTPNLDALAATGRVLTNYHTGSASAPSRAMLLTGLDHHLVGVGTTTDALAAMVLADHRYTFANLPSGYVGYLSAREPLLPQLLKDAGYHTYMVGKWNLATEPVMPSEQTHGLPFQFHFAAFPKAEGFERSFALLPDGYLHFAQPFPGPAPYVQDDLPVSVPANFYSSTFYTDKLIEFVDAGRKDHQPFFAYAAYTAPHAPLQAPTGDIAKYGGRYDAGYEDVRERRLERQRALGLITADLHAASLTTDQGGRPHWSDLTASQRAVEARKMEVYAAMVDNLDQNIGRLVQHLKDIGEYDNTLIIFTSDNGPDGTTPPGPPGADNSLDNIGKVSSSTMYGERWAEVSATPFSLWRGFSTEGGVSVPMIVRLPHQDHGAPALADLAHVTDLTPTVLAAAGAAVHTEFSGVSLLTRLEGQSSKPVRAKDAVLADELYGGGYAISGNWKLVSVQAPLGSSQWALYDLGKDRGETNNVISAHPEIAARLKKAWTAYVQEVGAVVAPFSIERGPAP